MKFGDLVKIEDIGIPAMFVRMLDKEVELELCGERFWMPSSLVEGIDFRGAV